MKSEKTLGLLSRVLVAGLLMHAGSTVAGANIVLFDNYVQPGYGHSETFGWVVDGTFTVAMPFTPSVNARLASLTLSVGSIEGTNVVDVKLHDDAGEVPGAEVESFHLIDPIPSSSPELPLVIDSVFHPDLLAGKQYWLSVHAASSIEGWWLSADSQDSRGTLARFRTDDPPPRWRTFDNTTLGVFRVEGSVPEPGTLALVGGGLLVLFRRRRQG